MRTRVILGSRWKSGLLCLAFLPSLMLLDAELRRDQVIWWAAGFFALCGLIGLVQLLRPARLTLTAEGFTYAGLGKAWSVQWRSIETLMLWRNPTVRGNQTLVGWIARPEARQNGVVAGVSRMLGVDGALPGLWSVSPEALLEVMQGYHAAATGAEPLSNA